MNLGKITFIIVQFGETYDESDNRTLHNLFHELSSTN